MLVKWSFLHEESRRSPGLSSLHDPRRKMCCMTMRSLSIIHILQYEIIALCNCYADDDLVIFIDHVWNLDRGCYKSNGSSAWFHCWPEKDVVLNCTFLSFVANKKYGIHLCKNVTIVNERFGLCSKFLQRYSKTTWNPYVKHSDVYWIAFQAKKRSKCEMHLISYSINRQ